MNIRKTRLWLALTGWLPWACYFGHHYWKTLYRPKCISTSVGRRGERLFLKSEYSDYTIAIRKACKRCGELPK